SNVISRIAPPSAGWPNRGTNRREPGEPWNSTTGVPVAAPVSLYARLRPSRSRSDPSLTHSLLYELDERSECRLRVHERHGRTARARAGRFVDHLVAVRLDRLERDRAVGDAVTHVMDALALLLHVLRHRRIRPRRRQQLDVGVGHFQQRLLHTVLLDHL